MATDTHPEPPATAVPTSPTSPTREALMDAAFDHLTAGGVLAGLNLREVADAVGVTPANIYHYFGSRRGLLRAAISHELDKVTEPIDVAVHSSLVDWRLAIFDLVQSLPAMRFTALLALDDDPDYEPLPLWDLAQQHYDRLRDAGEIDPDLDTTALHFLTLGVTMAVGIYGDATAAQLDVTRDELNQRVRALLATLLTAVAPEEPGRSPGDDA